MQFWRAIVRLACRKRLIIPLVLSAIAAGAAGYFLTPLRYESSTAMVLIPPVVGASLSQDPTQRADVTNPMINFSNDLKTATAILIHAMNTPEVATELGAGKDSPTQVTINDINTNPNVVDSNGPFVYITGESTSRAEAKNVVIRAQNRMRRELVDRQLALGAPPKTNVILVDVVSPTVPEVTRINSVKVGGFAFVLSLAIGLGIAYAWERSAANRRRRSFDESAPQSDQQESDLILHARDDVPILPGSNDVPPLPDWDPPTSLPRRSVRRNVPAGSADAKKQSDSPSVPVWDSPAQWPARKSSSGRRRARKAGPGEGSSSTDDAAAEG